MNVLNILRLILLDAPFKIRECCISDLFREEQLWVDSDIYNFASNLKDKFEGKLDDTFVEHLLLGLNSRFLNKVKGLKKKAHLFCKYCDGMPGKEGKRILDQGLKTIKIFSRGSVIILFNKFMS